MLDLSLNLTFIGADPARCSWFAGWDPASPGGLLTQPGAEVHSVELHLPAKRGTTKTAISAKRFELADAIDTLATLRHNDEASASAHAWASVVRAALCFIADGRVLPWVSPSGHDTWRVDPLDPANLELVKQLAAALPAEAYATSGPERHLISDPVFAVRSACDAIADRFLRTPAAHRVGSLTLFADAGVTKAPQLRPWVKDLAASHCASTRLVLRVHPPGSGEEGEPGDASPAGGWRVRFELQSLADPSLVVDAADFWTAPTEVMDRLGDQAEVTLLAGLRRLGEVLPPLESVLDETAPVEATLADADLDLLLDQLDVLADHNIDVRWPSDLVAPRIERNAVASTGAPSGAMASMLDLESLLTVNWEFLLDGVPLTAEELTVLGEAKRAVVPLRGKWVRLDRADRERLQARPPELSMADVLAAALLADTESVTNGSGDGADDETILNLDLANAEGTAGGADGSDGAERFGVRLEGSVVELVRLLRNLSTPRQQPEPLGLQAELRPYQRQGLAWLIDVCALGLGGCLADDMGLGKTIQILALHAHQQQAASGEQHPTLVVCPTSLLANWEREAATFIPDVPVRLYHGPQRSLDGVKPDELVVTSYGVIRGDAEVLGEVCWGLVVADEAQHAKNPRSTTARALRKIPARTRIALSGTPVENRLSELWSIFDWAVPGLLGPLETFRRTTAVPIERDGDPAAIRRLGNLIAPFLLRRRKTDPGIAPELPAKIERDVVVPLTAEQATLYKATVSEALAEVAATEGIQRRGMVLAMLTKLKQITNHPAQFLGEDGPLPGRSGKLTALDDLIAAATVNGESTLIFTQYVKMGRMLVAHLEDRCRVGLLHGSLSRNARQGLVDAMQNGELDVLVLSLKAGGTGLNLTAATQVVHYDRWWNPAVEDQATDRAYRIGQDQTVTVHRLFTKGTVEDRVAELLKAKRALADRVIGATGPASGEGWISELDDAELADLVRLETEGA